MSASLRVGGGAPGVSNNLLTPNQASVETDLSGFTFGVSTGEQSTDAAVHGTYGIKRVEQSGDSWVSYVQFNPAVPIAGGNVHTASFMARQVTPGVATYYVTLQWFDGAAGLVGNKDQVITLTDTFAQYLITDTAPIGAVSMNLQIWANGPVAGTVSHWDCFGLWEGTGTEWTLPGAPVPTGGTELAPVTLYDVTVDAGRDDIESQPDGSVLNATINGLAPAAIGDPITLTDPGGILFHGWVTDLTAELEPSDMSWSVKLTATGPLAMLGHMLAGQATYPEETDSARIYRILEESGALHAVDPGIIGPYILAREAEAEWAATLARSTADDGAGVLWEQPSDPAAPIRYLPERFRHWTLHKLTWSELPVQPWDDFGAVTWNDFNSDTIGQAPEAPGDLEVDPATTYAEATFTQQIDDLARTVTVTYGPEPDEGQRATVTVGTLIPAAEYDTQLAHSGDAAHYADNMLRRYQQPAWRLDHIRIPLHTLPPGEQATIRAALEVGTRLTVPFPLGSPVGYVWQGFLEGWRHELLGDVAGQYHYLELHTSERSLTESSDRWQDINPTITWDNTDPAMTWLDATTWRAA